MSPVFVSVVPMVQLWEDFTENVWYFRRGGPRSPFRASIVGQGVRGYNR